MKFDLKVLRLRDIHNRILGYELMVEDLTEGEEQAGVFYIQITPEGAIEAMHQGLDLEDVVDDPTVVITQNGNTTGQTDQNKEVS